MSITRIDFSFYEGRGIKNRSSSVIALNPENQPGAMVVAGSSAVRNNIGSQVACKLALEHFVGGVRQYFDRTESETMAPAQHTEAGLEVLEVAFRNANSSVYEFGHKLAAGGRMSAALVSLVLLDGVIAAGRVGSGAAYLCRQGEVFPFFETLPANESTNSQLLEAYVGSNSMVSVELASVPLAPLDLIFVFSRALDPLQEQELGSLLLDLDTGFTPEGQECSREGYGPDWNPCWELNQRLFLRAEEPDFTMLVAVGPDTIYLTEVI